MEKKTEAVIRAVCVAFAALSLSLGVAIAVMSERSAETAALDRMLDRALLEQEQEALRLAERFGRRGLEALIKQRRERPFQTNGLYISYYLASGCGGDKMILLTFAAPHRPPASGLPAHSGAVRLRLCEIKIFKK